MDWLGLALALVKLANMIFEWKRSSAQQAVGENRERLKQFQALQAVSESLKEVDARFEDMTDDEVRAELEKNGDFRN